MKESTKKWIFAFTLAFSILLEWFVRKGALIMLGTNGFDLWPWIDNVMHFAWGFNIFLVFLIIFKWEPIDALLGVFAWQMFWEGLEMIGDRVITQPEFMWDHFFFDGIKDTIVDMAGGLLAWRALAWKRKKGKPLKIRPFLISYAYVMTGLSAAGALYWAYTAQKGLPFTSPDLFAIYGILIGIVLAGALEFFKRKTARLRT